MVCVKGLAAVIGLGKGAAEEVPAVDRVPCLAHKFVVHLHTTALDILTYRSHFIICQGVLVGLGKVLGVLITDSCNDSIVVKEL